MPAARRRRPRDRIAELEAQIASLTKALQSQQFSSPGSNTPSNRHHDAEGTDLTEASHDTSGSKALAFLDSRVSMEIQQRALDNYAQHIFPEFPAIPLDTELTCVRRDSPILLFCAVAFVPFYQLPTKTRDELVQEAVRIFAAATISSPNRSLELVYALLVATFWFRARPGLSRVTLHQLVQLAMSTAIDIGIGGEQNPITPGAGDGRISHTESLGAQRVWLACFAGASALSTGIRRHDAQAQWTTYHESCWANLAMNPLATSEDRLFLHVVRGEKLCREIANLSALCDSTHLWDFTIDESQQVLSSMKRDVDNWTAEILPGADRKPVLFFRYSAIIYMNEPALHTSTNKLTFGSPFRLDKMAESDFARPIVTGDHVAALHALKDACHAMLDLATEPESTAFLATCPLPYVAKVFHSLFVLAKLYVSITAPNNTYGAVLRPSELRVGRYLERTKVLTASIEASNPGSLNSRILTCHVPITGWFKEYTAKIPPSYTEQPVPVSSVDSIHDMDHARVDQIDHGQDPGSSDLEWLMLDNTWVDDLVTEDVLFAAP